MEYELLIQNSSESTWTYEETMLLIQTYDKYKHIFDKGNRKSGWDIIITHLDSEGVCKTSAQVAKKWSNLLRTYRAIKCNNKKTGQSVIKFKYFEEMDQILGDKTIYSKAGVSVGLTNTVSKLDVVESSEEKENIEISESTSTMVPKKRSGNARQEYYRSKKQFFEEENERRQEDHQSKIESRKEKLILLKPLIDIQKTKQN